MANGTLFEHLSDMIRNVQNANRNLESSEQQPVRRHPVYASLRIEYQDGLDRSFRLVFQVPNNDNVTLALHNLFGDRIALLLDDFMKAGIHQIDFSDPLLPSGKYILRFSTTTDSCLRVLTVP